MTREQLTATFRVLAGIGILLLMLAFLRACLSPPPLPTPKPPSPAAAENSGSLYPPRY